MKQKPCKWCNGIVASDGKTIAHSIPECDEYKKFIASLSAELGAPKVDVIAIDGSGEATSLSEQERREAEEARASGKPYTVERRTTR